MVTRQSPLALGTATALLTFAALMVSAMAENAEGKAAQPTQPAKSAQPSNPSIPTTLKERQELMRQITQQQQSVLQQRFNCINRADNLADLERCERGYPVMMPMWRHDPGMGGWRCPMW
jgi:hypothetical protein